MPDSPENYPTELPPSVPEQLPGTTANTFQELQQKLGFDSGDTLHDFKGNKAEVLGISFDENDSVNGTMKVQITAPDGKQATKDIPFSEVVRLQQSIANVSKAEKPEPTQEVVDDKDVSLPQSWSQIYEHPVGKKLIDAMGGESDGWHYHNEYTMREFVRTNPQEAQLFATLYQTESGEEHPELMKAMKQVKELAREPIDALPENPRYAGLAYALHDDPDYKMLLQETDTKHKLKVFGTTDFQELTHEQFMDRSTSEANDVDLHRKSVQLFRQKFPDKADLYDERELTRVYRDPDGVINPYKDSTFPQLYMAGNEQALIEYAQRYPEKAQAYAKKVPELASYIGMNGERKVEMKAPENMTARNQETGAESIALNKYEDWSLKDVLEYSDESEKHQGSVVLKTIVPGIKNGKVSVDFDALATVVSFETNNEEEFTERITESLRQNGLEDNLDQLSRQQDQEKVSFNFLKGVAVEIERSGGKSALVKITADNRSNDIMLDVEDLGLRDLLYNSDIPDRVDADAISDLIERGNVHLPDGSAVHIKAAENKAELKRIVSTETFGTKRLYKAVPMDLAMKFAKYGIFSTPESPNLGEQLDGEVSIALDGYGKDYSALLVIDAQPDEYEHQGGYGEDYGVAAKKYKGNRKRLVNALPTFARAKNLRHIPASRIKEIIIYKKGRKPAHGATSG